MILDRYAISDIGAISVKYRIKVNIEPILRQYYDAILCAMIEAPRYQFITYLQFINTTNNDAAFYL